MVPHGDKVFLWNDHGDLILARLTPAGYQEIGRNHLLDPDMLSAGSGGRRVVWSHPAFANRSLYVRNNHEIICVSLAAPSRLPGGEGIRSNGMCGQAIRLRCCQGEDGT